MTEDNPPIHGKRAVYSASEALEAVARGLSDIKHQDKLTYADMGAILGKSEDQVAKYCEGTATMDFITFGRAKREWNGRFTGYFDKLCVDSRPGNHNDHFILASVARCGAELAEALAHENRIDNMEIHERKNGLIQNIESCRALLEKIGVYV